MSVIGAVYEDVTTDVVGQIGPWQWLVTFLSTVISISGMFNHFEDLFLVQTSQGIVCVSSAHEPFNSSLCIHSNSTTDKCTKWQLKLLGLVWMKKTWIVSCETHMQKFSMAMVCRLGSAFGCVIFGLVADGYGRRRALTIAIVTEVPLSLLLTFYDTESWFRLLIFLRSLIRCANGFIALILICEISSNYWRAPLCFLVASPQVFSSLLVLPLVNNMPNTDTYTFLGCFVNMVIIIALRWTPESPHWLIFNEKIKKAERIISLAAKTNGITLCDDFKIRPVNHRAYACLEQRAMCLEILTTFNIRVTTVVVILIWCMHELLWCLLYLEVFMSPPPQSLVLITFSCLLPYSCLTLFFTQKLNTRNVMLINLVFTGTFATGISFTRKTNESMELVLSSIALTSAITTRYLLLNITPRLFATNIRATFFGVCQAVGQVGSMISSILVVAQDINRIILSAILLSVTAVIAALSYALPVTDGRELPDVIEDMDYFSELTKPIRWATQKTNRPSIEEIELRVHSFGSEVREESPPRCSRGLVPRPPRSPCHRMWTALSKYRTRKFTGHHTEH